MPKLESNFQQARPLHFKSGFSNFKTYGTHCISNFVCIWRAYNLIRNLIKSKGCCICKGAPEKSQVSEMERGWFVSRETPSGVLLLKVYAGGEGASVSWRLPPKNSWETSAQPSSFAAFVDIPCAVGFSTPVVKELSSWFILINGAITNRVFLKYLESEWK